MNPAPVLDTHAWVWWVGRVGRLSRTLVTALDSFPADKRPFLCDISLWEVATRVARGRLSLTQPLPEWLEAAAHPRTVSILSITPESAADVARPPQTFHREPGAR